MFIAVAALCVVTTPLLAAERQTKVLIINGADPTLPAFVALDAAMRETSAKTGTPRFQFFSEALDANRFAFADFEQEFLTLLSKKYRGVTFDIVVPVTRPALDFVRAHWSELWPNASILFHSVPAQALQGIASLEREAGIVTHRTMGKTADLARKFQPNARRIVVIAGVSELDIEFVKEARSALANLPASMQVEYALGTPLPELVTLVSREQPDSIVLFFSYFRDRDGRPYVPRDVLRAITAVSPAPVYGTFETYFGQGIVAGIVETYTNRGRLVGERLMQLAAGESLPSLSVVPEFCAADARMLRKFSIDESRLPEGCEILFAERSLWREYRWQILGAMAVLLLQTALIAGLLLERERRRRAAKQTEKAMAETAQHRQNLAHLERVHTVGEMSTAIAHEINQPLAAVQSNAETGRELLAAVSPDLTELRAVLDDIAHDSRRASDVIGRLRNLLKKGETKSETVDLNELARSTVTLLHGELLGRRTSSILILRVRPRWYGAIPSNCSKWCSIWC